MERHGEEEFRSCVGYEVAVLPKGVGNLLSREAEEGASVPFDLFFQFKKKGDCQIDAGEGWIVYQDSMAGHAGQLADELMPAMDMRQEAEGNNGIVAAVGKGEIKEVPRNKGAFDCAAGSKTGETLSAGKAASQHGQVVASGSKRDGELGVSTSHVENRGTRPGPEQLKAQLLLDP